MTDEQLKAMSKADANASLSRSDMHRWVQLHNATANCYFVMEDCSEQSGERYNIYYDSDTQRSPIFERNLLKDGFHLKEWIE